MLPVWQKAVRSSIQSGDLVAVGVVQEQHPDRTRLYRQWRQLEWPILVDSMNVLDHIRVVPVPLAIDEDGVLVDSSFELSELEKFVQSAAPSRAIPDDYNRVSSSNFVDLKRAAEESGTADAWYQLGTAYFNEGAGDRLDEAVAALESAVALQPERSQAHFALGAALRRRSETEGSREPDDAQRAVDHWQEALDLDPNHYIFRRRLQQYGPRLDKPYNFYFWVEQARQEIRERGEEPVSLTAEPTGSEVAPPAGKEDRAAGNIPDPDPEGRINRDTDKLVHVGPLVTPKRVQPGRRVRVRVTFRLDPLSHPYWNNEADELRMWVGLPEGLEAVEHQLVWPNPEAPESREDRELEIEVQVHENASEGRRKVPAYALYYVCGDRGGVCYFLRQDFEFEIIVDEDAGAL